MDVTKRKSLKGVVREFETKRQALALIAQGAVMEIAISFMRERGFTKIGTIDFLVRHVSVPLKEAKEQVYNSAAWADTKSSDEELHERLTHAANKAGFVFVPSSSMIGDDES